MNTVSDISAAMNKENFFPREIIADGKIHRFKRNPQDKEKSAWVIAYQNNSTRGGEVFYVALWGDWHEPDNVYKYCSLTTQSTQDKTFIEQLIRQGEKRRLLEQEKIWDECAIKASEAWESLSDSNTSTYLKRKGIDSLYGARMAGGTVLCVPVRDVDDKLWGIQKIFDRAEKNKMFMGGTKKKGNFHVIRAEHEITDIVYVCEGFATAASIHMATGENVVVAFDAGNLYPVCENLRSRFREAAIVVCGDDDKWTTRPDGSPWNPGREAAEKAAANFLGKAVFPRFDDESKKLTDWNDLHVEQDLEAVTEQITGVKPTKYYIVALGHRNLTYYYTSNYNRQILAFNAHSADTLTSLQPLEYWEQLYTTKTGVDWQKAASDLKKECHAKGIFNPQRVRGLGVWLDAGRVIVHLGNRLLVDRVECGLHDLKGPNIYSLEETRPSISGAPLADCSVLLSAVKNIAWAREQDGIFFAGWMVSAMLSGVLQWRPHMWLLGGTGAGKSCIYEVIAKVMDGNVTTLAGGTSEAGLRRAVRGSALPLIFDEFELDSESSTSTNQQILNFMRQSSSDSVAQIIKADGASGTVSYQPRFCAFVAGIRPTFDSEADRNRFTVIRLDRKNQNAEQWAKVLSAMKQIDRAYSNALFLRCLSLIEVFRENIDVCRTVLAERHYARFAQQFSPILAGWFLLHHDKVVEKCDAESLIEALKLENEIEDIRDLNDEESAFNQLLSSKLRTPDGDRSVVELLRDARYNVSCDKALVAKQTLMRHGLKAMDGGGVFIANKHPELSKLFDKTRFKVNWNYSLSRIDNAKRNQMVKLHGKVHKGVILALQIESEE